MKKEFFGPKPEVESEKKAFESAAETVVSKESSRIERSPREIAELKDRLRFIAKVFLKNFDLKMVPGKGWAASLSKKFEEERRKHPQKSLEEFDEKLLIPEVLTYPEKHFRERSEEYIFGIFRHELGHFKHSDYQSLIEAQEWASAEGYKPLDVFVVYDGWEDGRSDNLESRTSKAARHRIGTYLKEDVATALLADLEKKSLPIQYMALCWAKNAESLIDGFDFSQMRAKIKDERVLRAFDETRDALAEYFQEPKGRKAFLEILWKKGWPVFKELIDKYIEDEAKSQRAKDIEGGGGSEEAGKDEGELKPYEGQENQSGDQKPEGQESGQEGQESESQAGDEEKESGGGEGGKDQGGWDELSEQEKEMYRKQARAKLDEEEREFIRVLQPRLIETEEQEDGAIEIGVRAVDAQDLKRAEAEEGEIARRNQATQEEIKVSRAATQEDLLRAQRILRENITGLTKKEEEEYNAYYAPVKKYIDKLVEKLDEIFPPKIEEGWQGGYRRGKRIDRKSLAREVPTKKGRFFERKEIPENLQSAYALLMDVSSSMMRNRKIQNAIQAAVLMAEAFSRKGIPFEILAFHTQLFELKKFNEPYFGKKKSELVRAARLVFGGGRAGTDAGFANDWAARRFQRQLLENDASGALIVLTDGIPEPPPEHAGPEWDLGVIVEKWSKKIPLVGVGIGPEMEEAIKLYYGKNGLPVPDVSKLPHELFKILLKQVERFGHKEAAGA